MSSTTKTDGVDFNDKAKDKWYDVCEKFKDMEVDLGLF
jgi:hypothetical protein